MLIMKWALDVEKMTLNEGPKMWVWREFIWWWCCYFAQQRWLPFHLGIAISVYIFNAIQRIKLQIGEKWICCMSIYIHEYYVSKLKGMLTLLGFVFCIREPKGSVTDWLAWLLGGFWLQGVHYFPNITCIIRVSWFYLFLTTGGV